MSSDSTSPAPGSNDQVHETSWSANLEGPEHADDRDRVLAESIDAVDRTAPGCHVNLVTHATHGHPSDYLFSVLHEQFGSKDGIEIDVEYVDQCGCGGYVTRVHLEE